MGSSAFIIQGISIKLGRHMVMGLIAHIMMYDIICHVVIEL